LVDDGSRDLEYQLKINKFKNMRIINLQKSVGIAGAVLAATKIAKYDQILPIPGHNMFSVRAIQNVIELRGKARLIIGCRNNLSKERPILKRLASKILLYFCRSKIAHYIGDFHGLILFDKCDILDFLRVTDGHGHAIRLISNVVNQGGLVVQTLAPIQIGHKKMQRTKITNLVPLPLNVFKVFLVFLSLKNEKKQS
jgi:glycosyltransferase involved in cell wall biosynthesis